MLQQAPVLTQARCSKSPPGYNEAQQQPMFCEFLRSFPPAFIAFSGDMEKFFCFWLMIFVIFGSR